MTNKKNMNNKILITIIVVMAIVIGVMGFFLGKMSNNAQVNNNTSVNQYEDVTIKVLYDKRDIKTNIDTIVDEIVKLPSLKDADVKRLEFKEDNLTDYLKENNIAYLPAIIFSTNNFNVANDPQQFGQNGQPAPKINTYLQALENGEYQLPLGSKFNPFVERSEKGFEVLTKDVLNEIKKGSYIKGNENSKITWLEYSDLECPYCARLHNSSTPSDLEKKYGDKLNKIFHHFPLGFHANAQTGAEILECLAEEKGTKAYYDLIKKSYANKKSDKSFLLEEAVKLGGNKANIEKCLSDGKFTDKVKEQMNFGTNTFGVTGTPGSVLINNETGEYEVISGAYPTESFVQIIDNLLK